MNKERPSQLVGWEYALDKAYKDIDQLKAELARLKAELTRRKEQYIALEDKVKIARQPMTDEQLEAICKAHGLNRRAIVRATEAFHGIKGETR